MMTSNYRSNLSNIKCAGSMNVFEVIQNVESDMNQIREDIKQIRKDQKEIKEDVKQIREDQKEIKEDVKQIREDLKEIKEDVKQIREDQKEIRQDLKGIKEDLRQFREQLNLDSYYYILADGIALFYKILWKEIKRQFPKYEAIDFPEFFEIVNSNYDEKHCEYFYDLVETLKCSFTMDFQSYQILENLTNSDTIYEANHSITKIFDYLKKSSPPSDRFQRATAILIEKENLLRSWSC